MADTPEETKARDAVARVRSLHHKVLADNEVLCRECSYKFPGILYLTRVLWPCPTIKTLEGEEK